jgi:hypothetical protein
MSNEIKKRGNKNMKKLLLVLFILILSITLTSCKKEEPHRNIIDFIKLDLIDEFGIPQDENTEYEDIEYIGVKGNATLVIGERDSSHNMILIDNNKVVMLEFVMEESPSKAQTWIWNLMIRYVDIERKIKIELDYYIYGRFMVPDYTSIKIPMSYYKFAELIEPITMLDIETLLDELGYNEVLL